MAFITVTRLRLSSVWYLPRFVWLTVQVQSQARRAPGFLSAGYLRDHNLAFWTKTAWEDEFSMRAFKLSGAHLRAIPALKEMCDEASGVSWSQDSLPSWQEAHVRLQESARYVFVQHPSDNQKARRSDPPRHRRSQ
jgi:hypothetical protein